MGKGYRILIVEDSLDLRMIWGKLFKNTPYHVRFCETASAALEAVAREGCPDVLISDFFLPDMNGMDLLGKIGRNYGYIPFILVTGNRDTQLIGKIEGLPGAAYLQKPVRFKRLLQTIQELLDKEITPEETVKRQEGLASYSGLQ